MDKLSDHYYNREFYFKTNQVPTQCVIKKHMKPPLAKVYFNSMKPPLKVLAGLEPSLKGGGDNWYQPPADLLKTKTVLRPIKPKILKLLSSDSIITYGAQILEAHIKRKKKTVEKIVLDKENQWKNTIKFNNYFLNKECSRLEAKNNTMKLQKALEEFKSLYRSSLENLEEMLMQGVIEDIQKLRKGILERKEIEYEEGLKQQSLRLQEKYDDMLMKEKTRLKAEFKRKLEKHRHAIGHQLHDINVEKHIAIEKLRHFLHNRNLACQVYVALKEREECEKEISTSKRQHNKTVKEMKETIDLQNLEISLQKEKQLHIELYKNMWKTKVQVIVDQFQIFVQYCLQNLPEVADFFINLEKLLMIQLSKVLVDKNTESIFESKPVFIAPKGRPHPYYLFYDKATPDTPKIKLDETLCPEHCSSSATMLPVIVVNKNCIYSACGCLNVFTNTVKPYLKDEIENEDFEDDDEYAIPVTYTLSQQRQELRLESSLVNVIQNEIVNLKNVDPKCKFCKLPHCFPVSRKPASPTIVPLRPMTSKSKTYPKLSRSQEQLHEREPQWESYMKYVLSKERPLMEKKFLENMPPYMRNTSKFQETELLNYKKCPIEKLKLLATKSNRLSLLPNNKESESKTKCTGTQYDDNIITHTLFCECFRNTENYIQEMEESVRRVLGNTQLRINNEDLFVSSSFLTQASSKFAFERAHSLRKIIGSSEELKVIFKRPVVLDEN